MADYGRREFPVTIIVRAHGNPELTERCLASINANTKDDQYGLILVDQERAYQVYSFLVANSGGYPLDIGQCTIVGLDENMGAVRATNIGLQLAMLDPSDFILVLDNDTRIPDGDATWLERWVRHFDDEGIGAAGATSDYVIGAQNIACTPRTYTKAFEGEGAGRPSGQKGPVLVTQLISFACMYRKSALCSVFGPHVDHVKEKEFHQRQSVGPSDVQLCWLWDERFEPGNSEDSDISLRLMKAGWNLAIARDVYIHHVGSQAFAQGDFQELLERNSRLLCEKWNLQRAKNVPAMAGPT